MRILHKVLAVVLVPLLLLAGSQFFTIDSTFNLIEDARSTIFLSSATEVKYASDALFMTGLINSALFEIHSRSEAGDSIGVSETVRRYREIQQQRYYSIQKLKEAVSGNAATEFDFIRILDSNRSAHVLNIEMTIAEIDALNEEIVLGILSSGIADNNSHSINALIIQSNNRTLDLSEELASFTNERYVKIEEANALVEESEDRARNTLNMIVLTGYLLSGIIVIFIYYLILHPIENFVRAIEVKNMKNVDWRSFESIREDEIGIIYRFIDSVIGVKEAAPPSERKKLSTGAPITVSKRKRSRRAKAQ